MTTQSNFGLYYSGTYVPFACDISGVALGQTTMITTSVNHGFIVGNEVTFLIPRLWGVSQLNGLKGLVLAFTNNTITVNIDSTMFDAFITPTVTLPVVIDTPQVLPVGDQNTGYVLPGGSPPPLQIPGTYRNTYP